MHIFSLQCGKTVFLTKEMNKMTLYIMPCISNKHTILTRFILVNPSKNYENDAIGAIEGSKLLIDPFNLITFLLRNL